MKRREERLFQVIQRLPKWTTVRGLKKVAHEVRSICWPQTQSSMYTHTYTHTHMYFFKGWIYTHICPPQEVQGVQLQEKLQTVYGSQGLGDIIQPKHAKDTQKCWWLREKRRKEGVGDKKVHASWRRGNKRKKENKSKKEQLLKMLSWKCFRWPLTSNKSSVFLNTEKSLLTSELIPATVTSKNNKAHKNIKVHPLQLAGGKKRNVFSFSDEKHLNQLNLL